MAPLRPDPLLAALTGDAETAGHFAPEAEISALLRVEAALAESQAGLGDLDLSAAARIAEACRTIAIDAPGLRRGLARDGVVVPELVRQLRAAAGEAGAGVHHGATSQDIIDTGLMLRLRDVLALHRSRLDGILDTLARLSRAQGHRPLMAQTRMQAALPFTVADKIATWARPLAAHRDRLGAISAGLPIQLGGPIGNGEGFGPRFAALRAAMAHALALRDAPPWQSDRTPVLDIAQAFALASGTLAKFGQDLALMAQTGTATVSLSGGGGSSAMAHKQNPVAAEVLVALGRLNAGLLGTLSQAMIHENERSGAAWTLEWLLLPQMAEATGRACTLAADLLTGIRLAPQAPPETAETP